MAKHYNISVQSYPRINDEADRYFCFLDDQQLTGHTNKLAIDTLKQIIIEGIEYANEKSRRHILFEELGHDEKQKAKKYEREADNLLKYFIRYCGDPAATAYDCLNRHYSDIATEAFRNRILQMERMNSGWRYQYIAKETARQSGRFDSVSDLNLQEADFVTSIPYKTSSDKLNIYVSVKNRSNTMGGQDWPKAILALESVASSDKNRKGPYVCVFGIAMEKGARGIRKNSKTGKPYSINTEIWFSNFFWLFFTNFSYEEISNAMLEVLLKEGVKSSINVGLPHQVVEHFGKLCSNLNLIDSEGNFSNPQSLLKLFCGNQ